MQETNEEKKIKVQRNKIEQNMFWVKYNYMISLTVLKEKSESIVWQCQPVDPEYILEISLKQRCDVTEADLVSQGNSWSFDTNSDDGSCPCHLYLDSAISGWVMSVIQPLLFVKYACTLYLYIRFYVSDPTEYLIKVWWNVCLLLSS